MIVGLIIIFNIVGIILFYVIVSLLLVHINDQDKVIEEYRKQAAHRTKIIQEKNLKIKELEKSIEVIE